MNNESKIINKRSKVPYYHQLYWIFRDKITYGELSPGDQIPTELALSEEYQVSRNTIRNMVDMLVNEGYLIRQRGKGTFIKKPSFEQGLVRIFNFTEEMQQRGLAPSSKVISSDIIPATEEIAESLNVEAYAELAQLTRLRIADGESISIEITHLNHSLCPNVLNLHNYDNVSLRNTLRDDFNINIMRATQKIKSVNASHEIANLLEISPKSALLFIERISYTDRDIPIEFLQIYYRGDRYTLYNELNA
ncbi:MAG: GntR family transcriptional regulator [Pelolinea sp.]|nr:GntR family transcriptional regulator [Pelolinea sp.]